jgi:hypothetical protein
VAEVWPAEQQSDRLVGGVVIYYDEFPAIPVVITAAVLFIGG